MGRDSAVGDVFMSGENYALLVGVSKYDEEAPLPACATDAIEMRDALIGVGFDSENVYLLAEGDAEGISAPPLWEKIYDRLEAFQEMDLDKDDTILFYFSGHGVRADGDYLLPPAARRKRLDKTAYSVEEIITDYLLPSGSRQIVMLLDACREEMGSTEKSGTSQKRGIGSETRSFLDNLSSDQQGVAVIFSCAPEEKSFIIEDDAGTFRSSFSKCLVDAIRSPNHITLRQITDYLVEEVPKLNVIHNRRPQKPYLVPIPHEIETLGLFGDPGVLSTEVEQIILRVFEFEAALGEDLVDEILEFVDSDDWHRPGIHNSKRKRVELLCRKPVAETPADVVERFARVWTTFKKVGSGSALRSIEVQKKQHRSRDSQ